MERDNLAKEMMSIVENLDTSQLKLEKNAFDVINSSDTSLNLVKEGISEIEILVKKIDELNENVKVSRQNMEHMKEVSKVIADFAKVISGIANKTNMLSLNASIEAARAGEQGRGFAVVAKEVQELASQSKTSSAEITKKIEEVQTYVNDAVTFINQIYENATAQNEMAETVSGLLKNILEAANVANDVSRNIENEIADNAKNTLQEYI